MVEIDQLQSALASHDQHAFGFRYSSVYSVRILGERPPAPPGAAPMPVNPADSPILGTLYGSDAMRAVFDERAYFQRMLDVEAALARVQARLGIIPAEAAEAITRAARRREPEHRGTRRQRAQCRLSGRRPGRRLVAGRRRGGRLDALGRHDAGHHGHRHRAADARRPDADPRRARRAWSGADRPRRIGTVTR